MRLSGLRMRLWLGVGVATIAAVVGTTGAFGGSGGGTIATIAGTSVQSFSGDAGPATSAQLSWPAGAAVDGQRNVYIADFNNRVRKIGKAAPQGSPYRTYRLRWPSRPGQTATYHLRFKSPRLRAMSLHVYGKAVPRGFAFDFIVACEHRGPAILDWDWTQSGGYVRIKVTMTTGLCDLSGPTVAGTYAALTFRRVT